MNSEFGNVVIIVSGRQPVVTRPRVTPQMKMRGQVPRVVKRYQWTRFRVRENVGGASEDRNRWRCMQWRTAITSDR